MKKGIIILVILILFSIIAGVLLYFLLERPMSVDSIYNVKINIAAKEFGNNHSIVTGYKIFDNAHVFAIGNTSSSDGNFVLEKVMSNTTITILSYNVLDQKFYTYRNTITTTDNSVYRVTMILKKQEFLNITQINDIEGKFQLNLESSYFPDPIMCVDWSTHFIYVRSNYEVITNPKRYSNFSRCYDLGISVEKNQPKEVLFEYKIFNKITDKDYINIVFIDSDEGITENDLIDVGGEDIFYKININNI